MKLVRWINKDQSEQVCEHIAQQLVLVGIHGAIDFLTDYYSPKDVVIVEITVPWLRVWQASKIIDSIIGNIAEDDERVKSIQF